MCCVRKQKYEMLSLNKSKKASSSYCHMPADPQSDE